MHPVAPAGAATRCMNPAATFFGMHFVRRLPPFSPGVILLHIVAAYFLLFATYFLLLHLPHQRRPAALFSFLQHFPSSLCTSCIPPHTLHPVARIFSRPSEP
jgi:hypothetical protein